VLLCLGWPGVNGWGEVGHKAIAELAADYLTPTAKSAVAHYLGAMQMYQVAPQPDDYSMGDGPGHFSEPYHFYNMNKGDTSFHFSECPVPPSCNVYAIQNFTKALSHAGASGPFCSSENDPNNVFPCPLIWLIHVVGDAHQPLHCGYGYDRGGNDVKCTWFGKSTELHAVWDSQMIYSYLDPSGGDWYALYQYLASDLKANPHRVTQFASNTNVVAWANESISYVISTVYNYGPSVEFNAQGELALGQWYYNQNWPIVTLRLEAAGIRLATLLNNVFANFDATKELPTHFQQSLSALKEQAKKKAAMRL